MFLIRSFKRSFTVKEKIICGWEKIRMSMISNNWENMLNQLILIHWKYSIRIANSISSWNSFNSFWKILAYGKEFLFRNLHFFLLFILFRWFLNLFLKRFCQFLLRLLMTLWFLNWFWFSRNWLFSRLKGSLLLIFAKFISFP